MGATPTGTDTEQQPPAGHDPYEALRVPDYRRLLAGNIFGALAMEMQSVAVGWELYLRTDSAAALGYVGLAQFLPALLLALPAGHAADRFSRKRMYLFAQSLMALAAVGLLLLSVRQGPVPLVYLCLIGIGVARACNAPARAALVAQVVGPEALPNAITWNSSGWQIASMVGPALGGVAIAATGQPAWAYGLTALLFLCSMALVSGLRPRPYAQAPQTLTLDSLLAGLRFVFGSRLILATLTLDLFAVLLGGATALLPIFARDLLRIGPTGLGWLRAAPSIGALAMALVLAHRAPMARAGRALLISVAGFGVATIAFGLSRDPLFSFLLLIVAGALDNVSIVVRGTLVQLLTPDAMRGRVSAVNTLFIMSSNELGAFESGITASWWGPVAAVVVGGFGTLAVVAGAMLRWPELLTLGPLHRTLAESTTPRAPASTMESSA